MGAVNINQKDFRYFCLFGKQENKKENKKVKYEIVKNLQWGQINSIFVWKTNDFNRKICFKDSIEKKHTTWMFTLVI